MGKIAQLPGSTPAIVINTEPVERGGQVHYLSRSDQFGTQRLGMLIEGETPAVQATEGHVYRFTDKPKECCVSLAQHPFNLYLYLSADEALAFGQAIVNAAKDSQAAADRDTHLVGHA